MKKREITIENILDIYSLSGRLGNVINYLKEVEKDYRDKTKVRMSIVQEWEYGSEVIKVYISYKRMETELELEKRKEESKKIEIWEIDQLNRLKEKYEQ